MCQVWGKGDDILKLQSDILDKYNLIIAILSQSVVSLMVQTQISDRY
jgi:hypothetical protein